MQRKLILITAGLVVLVALFFVVRPKNKEAAPPAATPGAPAVTAVTVRVADGAVQGPERVKTDAGSKVRITVTSDAADEIHVHGYDLMQDVRPGEPATITFVADAPGVFEVELEDARLPLFELEVSA